MTTRYDSISVTMMSRLMLNLHRTAAQDTCGSIAANPDYAVSTNMVFEARVGPGELRSSLDLDSYDDSGCETLGALTILETPRENGQDFPNENPVEIEVYRSPEMV